MEFRWWSLDNIFTIQHWGTVSIDLGTFSRDMLSPDEMIWGPPTFEDLQMKDKEDELYYTAKMLEIVGSLHELNSLDDWTKV